MTSARPYRAHLSFATAFDEITRQAGTQFDPTLARAFKGARREIARLARMLSRNTEGLRKEMNFERVAAEMGAVS